MGEPLSESALHRWLGRTLRGPRRGRLPLGDDAAALPLGGNRVALLTTDALVEWTHFLPATPPEAIGAAVANASLSDIAAKGGRPVALTLDLLLTGETTPDWARSVIRAADRAMARWGAAVVGGDTKSAECRAVVGTVMGLGRADRLAPHSGLRNGDRIVTTGVVGAGGVAYREFTGGDPSDLGHLRALLGWRPRVREGAALVGFASAMIDSSDGLAESVRRLAEASGTRVEIDSARLPLHRKLDRAPDGSIPSVTFFGGDYELVAGIRPQRLEAARSAVRRAGGRLTEIGVVERGRGAGLRTGDSVAPMPPAGWQAFGFGPPAGGRSGSARAVP